MEFRFQQLQHYQLQRNQTLTQKIPIYLAKRKKVTKVVDMTLAKYPLTEVVEKDILYNILCREYHSNLVTWISQ